MALNISPAKWAVVPAPKEPNDSLPGWALASATSSLTLLAGTEGCASSTSGEVPRMPSRFEALDRVVGQRGLERRVDRERGVGTDQQRIAVRCGLSHVTGTDGGAGAGLVLDDHRLAELLRHGFGQNAAQGVGGAAGGIRHDQRHRPLREVLGKRDQGQSIQDVGGGALNRHVHRHALGGGADLAVAAGELRHRALAAEHRAHHAGRAAVLERLLDEAAHAREAREVGVDELLRGLLRHADVLGQREGGLAVEQRVVDDLGAAPQLVAVEAALGPEHLERRLVVDVVAAREGRGQRLVARQVRQHAQLDLRVVGRDEHVAGLGDEGAADLAAERGADRDVLQVRIAAAQASGGGHRLVEHRVHAAGDRMDQRRQRVDVGALQLRQAAPVEDEARQVVGQRQFLEHFHGGRRRARRAGALQHRQLQLVEQDLAELLRASRC